MKEIRSRWTVLVLWLAVIGTLWLSGEAVGWKRVRTTTNSIRSRTVLAMVGPAGIVAWGLHGKKEQ